MPDYIELPLVTDADALLESGVDYLETALPGFQARPGNVETVLLESGSQIAAEVVEQAAQVPPVIFAYAGAGLYGIPLREATPATSQAVITFAASTPAVMVPAGSLISVPHPSGEAFAFETDQDATAPAGGGDITVGITALEAGAEANGCYGTAELVDVIDGVELVTVSTTSGGTDQEDEDEYLDRLADTLSIYAPRPILPADFATMARQVPGVARALAIDLLQPPASSGGVGSPRGAEPNGTTPVARCTTVAITADGGGAPSSTLLQTVYDVLDQAREVNFLVYVIPPTYTTVEVRATVMALAGWLAADVAANVQAELAVWLDPATDTGTGTETTWSADTKVRLYEAVDWINRAAGVHYVVSVELRKTAGTWAAADIALTGVAPLPLLGAVPAITVQTP